MQTESSRDPIVVDLPLALSTKIRDFQQYARPVLTGGGREGTNHECLLVAGTGKPLTDVTLAQLWASIQETHKAPWGAPVTLRMFRHGYATRAHAAVLNGIAAVGPAVLQPQADAMGNSLRMWREVYIDGRNAAIAQTATRIAATLTSEPGGYMRDARVGTDGPGPSRVHQSGGGVARGGAPKGDPWQPQEPQGFSEEESGWCSESAGAPSTSSPCESTCSSGSQGEEDAKGGASVGLHMHRGTGVKRSYGEVAVAKVGAPRKRRLRRLCFIDDEAAGPAEEEVEEEVEEELEEESSPSPSPSASDREVAGTRVPVVPGTAGSGEAVEHVGSQPIAIMRNASGAGPSASAGGKFLGKSSAGWLSFLATGNRN